MGRVKRTYSKKKKKSIFKSRVFWIVLILFSSISFFLYLLLFNSFYQLKDVKLNGAELTTESSLVNFVKRNSKKKFIFESNSLLFSSNFSLKDNILDSYPHIEGVDIEKIFPETLKVSITEREEAAIWCKGKDIYKTCYKIDDQGVAYQMVEFDEDHFEIDQQIEGDVTLGKKTLSGEKISFIFKAKEEVEEFFELERMVIPHARSLYTETEEGFEIRLDFKSELEDQIERLDILLSEEIEEVDGLEYIDLRYVNSVYYK
ncbi:MAG: cell division protein FtsQ/DivIB [Patescibacteria group bacterium]